MMKKDVLLLDAENQGRRIAVLDFVEDSPAEPLVKRGQALYSKRLREGADATVQDTAYVKYFVGAYNETRDLLQNKRSANAPVSPPDDQICPFSGVRLAECV